ncbi:MAG: hypothetical protein ACPL5I_05925, partial [Thermodesulfobacteriota bacterium]
SINYEITSITTLSRNDLKGLEDKGSSLATFSTSPKGLPYELIGMFNPPALCGKKMDKYKDVNSQLILISPRLSPPEADQNHAGIYRSQLRIKFKSDQRSELFYLDIAKQRRL